MAFLAIDIGASSGRHMLGERVNGKIELKEVYRFKNGPKMKGDHLCWNGEQLFNDILAGMKKCGEMGVVPESVAIDCFGVDFVLLDENDNLIGDTVSYRDNRTLAIRDELHSIISEDELFNRTGIAYQPFNTIYQLYAVKKETPEDLKRAKTFLMLPEYFNFLLSGVKMNEFTNASTTMMVNVDTREYDKELLEKLGIPSSIFGKLNMPSTVVGELRPEIQKEVGYNCKVVLAASHDTGSAVMTVPNEDDAIYISSGTWSLMGVLLDKPNCSPEAKKAGFTNEGAFDGKVRFLKNITGFWVIQQLREQIPINESWGEMAEIAEKSGYNTPIDINSELLFAPENMKAAVLQQLENQGAPKPKNVAELLSAVYHGMAYSYKQAVIELEKLTGKNYKNIYIIGGGSLNQYVNKLAEEYSGKKVIPWEVEATAIGNITAQENAK